MGGQKNDKVEVNAEVNSIETSDCSTIANNHYSLPPTFSTGVSIEEEEEKPVKEKDALLVNVK